MTGIEIIVGGAITTTLAYLFGKKKTKAEIQKTELDSVEKAISIWRSLAIDFKKEVDELKGQVLELRDENKALRKEVERLSDIIDENGIPKH